MATVYFQLERSKKLKDHTHPIYLVCKLKEDGKEKRFRYYTSRSALSKHWIGKGDTKKISAKAPVLGSQTTGWILYVSGLTQLSPTQKTLGQI